MSKQYNLPPDAKITGWWGNEPIWRQKTAGEKLVDVLKENKKIKNAKNKFQ